MHPVVICKRYFENSGNMQKITGAKRVYPYVPILNLQDFSNELKFKETAALRFLTGQHVTPATN